MAYFKSEDSYAQRQKNEGFFRLDDCTSIAVVGEYQGFKTAFAIHGPRQKHILVAESRYAYREMCACVCCMCAREREHKFICASVCICVLLSEQRYISACWQCEVE